MWFFVEDWIFSFSLLLLFRNCICIVCLAVRLAADHFFWNQNNKIYLEKKIRYWTMNWIRFESIPQMSLETTTATTTTKTINTKIIKSSPAINELFNILPARYWQRFLSRCGSSSLPPQLSVSCDFKFVAVVICIIFVCGSKTNWGCSLLVFPPNRVT